MTRRRFRKITRRKTRGFKGHRVSHRRTRGSGGHRKMKGGYTPTMRRCGSGLCSVGGRQTIVTYVDPDSDSVPQFVSAELAESMNENL